MNTAESALGILCYLSIRDSRRTMFAPVLPICQSVCNVAPTGSGIDCQPVSGLPAAPGVSFCLFVDLLVELCGRPVTTCPVQSRASEIKTIWKGYKGIMVGAPVAVGREEEKQCEIAWTADTSRSYYKSSATRPRIAEAMMMFGKGCNIIEHGVRSDCIKKKHMNSGSAPRLS